jgi:predicted transcriptional regulator
MRVAAATDIDAGLADIAAGRVRLTGPVSKPRSTSRGKAMC